MSCHVSCVTCVTCERDFTGCTLPIGCSLACSRGCGGWRWKWYTNVNVIAIGLNDLSIGSLYGGVCGGMMRHVKRQTQACRWCDGQTRVVWVISGSTQPLDLEDRTCCHVTCQLTAFFCSCSPYKMTVVRGITNHHHGSRVVGAWNKNFSRVFVGTDTHEPLLLLLTREVN